MWKVTGSLVSQDHQANHKNRNRDFNSFLSACLDAVYDENQLEDIIIQSSSQVLCHKSKLELMALPEPVMCRSEHCCLEHALCFPAGPLFCHLYLK